MPLLGRMKKLNISEIREIWPNEEKDLSPWVAEHIDILNETLVLRIEIGGMEEPVHNFRVDLVGTDNSQQIPVPVVIENQFGISDHDHLGKLITYSANREAGIIIWICNELQVAHKQALEWLNKITPLEMTFYGVELEMYKIDDSNPAPLFRIIAGPPPSKRPPRTPELSPRYKKYQDFFNNLRNKVLSLQPNITRAKAFPQSWWGMSIGRSGFSVSSSFTIDSKFRVELYIDYGKKELNDIAFEDLFEKRNFIEEKLDTELIWDRLPEKRACRIYKAIDGTIDDNDKHDQMINWAAPLMIKFKDVFGPLIKNIQLE